MRANTLREVLDDATTRLARVGDCPRLEAELLLAHALNKPRSHLHAWPDKCPDPAGLQRFQALLAGRLAGDPVAYLLGQREFWSLMLTVSPDVLIPRPETERLVELALDLLPPHRPRRVADLGTGSGAIALAIAGERPQAIVTATDNSPAALAVARDNARRLGLDNVVFRQGDWCGALRGRFHIIVSNPPYIADTDPHLRQGDLRFEPPPALAAGPRGLDALTRITQEAVACLEPGGWLLLEHGWQQGEAVRELLAARGLARVETLRDLAGRERVSRACRLTSPGTRD